jgi:hypothetical protein
MIMAAGLTAPVEPETKDFPLFGDSDPSIAVYRPQGWSRPGVRPEGAREAQPAREDNVEVPAYLRKGKSGTVPGVRG